MPGAEPALDALRSGLLLSRSLWSGLLLSRPVRSEHLPGEHLPRGRGRGEPGKCAQQHFQRHRHGDLRGVRSHHGPVLQCHLGAAAQGGTRPPRQDIGSQLARRAAVTPGAGGRRRGVEGGVQGDGVVRGQERRDAGHSIGQRLGARDPPGGPGAGVAVIGVLGVQLDQRAGDRGADLGGGATGRVGQHRGLHRQRDRQGDRGQRADELPRHLQGDVPGVQGRAGLGEGPRDRPPDADQPFRLHTGDAERQRDLLACRAHLAVGVLSLEHLVAGEAGRMPRLEKPRPRRRPLGVTHRLQRYRNVAVHVREAGQRLQGVVRGEGFQDPRVQVTRDPALRVGIHLHATGPPRLCRPCCHANNRMTDH